MGREADANFLSVYHLIGPRNQPETFQRTIEALFELHDIFDINRDMQTGRASPSLPQLERVDSVHIIYQFDLKLDQKHPSVLF